MRRFYTLLVAIALSLPLTVCFPARLHAADSSAFERTVTALVAHNATLMKTANDPSQSLGMLTAGDRLIIEGRDELGGWWYVRSAAGRGYVYSTAVQPEADVSAVRYVAESLPAPDKPTATPVSDPTQFPILPTISDFTRRVYQRGLQMGNQPDVFSKVGDCMTADSQLFLGQFGSKRYKLGSYDYLQPVVDLYQQSAQAHINSFVWQSQAAYTGYNAASVEDTTWTTPGICHNDETPLACEFRVAKPSVDIIMFGTNDISTLTTPQFDFYLRLVVHDSITNGVVPLLTTFPGDPSYEPKTQQMNQVIYGVGRDYEVPVVNLWAALQPLPGHGRRNGSAYLTRPAYAEVSDLTAANLRYGYTMRNLVTLQALYVLQKGVADLAARAN